MRGALAEEAWAAELEAWRSVLAGADVAAELQ